ncbi:DUF4259 domain-containing protein [Nocardioides speluncae]|uniref:DUF4259 domain-containing protein n=1 Tax=Nocardioides speluncae TaxID=2670337 RepID=UPI000D68ECF8|nr:DUF4259 domain-containing protein [Nocardioides speluncae]
MGAWGTGIFDNDHAADWSASLEEAADPLAFLSETLTDAADEKDLLDLHVASAAAAAAAVVASTLPDGPPVDPKHGPEGLELPDLSELALLALRALDRISADDSEWRDLWDEVGQLTEAQDHLDTVATALQQST